MGINVLTEHLNRCLMLRQMWKSTTKRQTLHVHAVIENCEILWDKFFWLAQMTLCLMMSSNFPHFVDPNVISDGQTNRLLLDTSINHLSLICLKHIAWLHRIIFQTKKENYAIPHCVIESDNLTVTTLLPQSNLILYDECHLSYESRVLWSYNTRDSRCVYLC